MESDEFNNITDRHTDTQSDFLGFLSKPKNTILIQHYSTKPPSLSSNNLNQKHNDYDGIVNHLITNFWVRPLVIMAITVTDNAC